MRMTKAQANVIINTLFAEIPDIYQSCEKIREKMFRMEKEAEKNHRYGHSVKSFSVGQAAKYFTVKHLFDGVTAKYTIESMIDIRHEVLLGCAYARRYSEELRGWMEVVHASKFAEIDYSELMK